MKRLVKIAAIILGILFLLVLAIPLFVNVDSFRPEIEEKLSAALGRTVHIGKISASILSGGAEATDVSISDDPAFNKGSFVKASSLAIGLKWIPLIFSRQIKVTSLTIKNPDIVLLKNNAGRWNYSSLGNSAGKAAPEKKSAPDAQERSNDLSVGKFQIQDGTLRVGRTSGNSAGKEQVYQKVNILARDISADSIIPFTLSAVTPGGGALELEGQAGPLNHQDSARTPLDAKVNLEHADLASTGFLDPNSGVGGIVDYAGNIKSDGRQLHSDGKANASNLRLVKGGSPARRAVNLDYNSDYDLNTDVGTLKANLHTGNSLATAGGSLNSRGDTTIAHLKVQGENMAVNDIEGLLPAFGVVMPSGASLQGGTLNMNLNAEGPLDHLVITGPVNISGTHLSGFNLASKLGAISAFTGLQPSTDTVIQRFSSGLRVAAEGIRADNLVLEVPSIGTLSGDGVIGANSSLDFKMLAKLAGAGGLLGKFTNISGSGQGKGGIPFLIKGTTSNPVFMPALGNLAGSTLQNLQGGSQGQQGIGGLLGGILNKKKK
ncbi:MAG TPA: AsmA family protein [Candidatus Angelobacter sp.]|jgi:AsmA protein|nr:AsmA family protein [Candidatus Angelobacter sp.]